MDARFERESLRITMALENGMETPISTDPSRVPRGPTDAGRPKIEGVRAVDLSVYVPQSGLQGEDLPAHVRWGDESVRSIRITLPPELTIKEIYNVDDTSIRHLADSKLEFRNFEVPGYLGLVFGTSHVESGKREVVVTVELLNGVGEVVAKVIRAVILFRPLLKAGEIHRGIFGIAGDVHGSPRLSPELTVSNTGDGTAVVFVQLLDSKTATISRPSKLNDFLIRYRTDLISGLTNVSRDFPKFTALLAGYLAIIEDEGPPTARVKREVKKLDRRLANAMERSDDFMAAVIDAVSRAFIKNVEVVTEMHSFLDYLNSIGTGRVIIMNALDTLKLPLGSSLLRVRVHVTDLQWGEYPPIDLEPFIVETREATEVPVYGLFAWNHDVKFPS